MVPNTSVPTLSGVIGPPAGSCLLRSLCKQVERITLVEAVPEMERESSYTRQVGYQSVRSVFHAQQALP